MLAGALLAASCGVSEPEVNAELCYSIGYNVALSRTAESLGKKEDGYAEGIWEDLEAEGITRGTQNRCAALYVEQYQRGLSEGQEDARGLR